MKLKVLLNWLPVLIISSLTFLAFWQRQNLMDWLRLRGYRPPTRVVAVANTDTMTDYSRHLFYVYHPEFDDKTMFNGHCRIAEETIVLGCYVENKGIYVYDVKDPRLIGIHEVTAAHELLHAAYDRLSRADRDKINKWVTDYFASVTDQRLIDTVNSYKKRDPSVVPNELHSILGTEVKNLPPDLENYYKRYFVDRSQVVSLSEKYEKTFTDIKNQVAADDAQLAILKARIDANEAELNTMSDELNNARHQLDAQLASGDVKGYNASVPGFNQKVKEYNDLLSATKALISQYNQIVEARNQLAAQEQSLIQAIDSRLNTQTQE